ncbi:helix-turn-helix domain-containing protein [Streptomyces cocklensis]|uniref:AraC family transcriptional regulator n=1 Tax=Actinacidiphila cocklensis TaxID=887465 RepID=A0A9W4DVY5_9ACTN|nr:helix-turn-helix domain-containing protein [Actinacidiphila cocklensis]MDD1059872.1 helix-turn-helix domain-containing protein [Actinacidiphila cocklensis]CAG6397173.1 AraC family transcriptional regulator [Actinacidiphila cocklensis]
MAGDRLTGSGAFAFSTLAVPPHARSAAWQAALSRAFGHLRVTVKSAGTWSGTLRAEHFESLRIVTEESGPAEVVRSGAADGRDQLMLRHQLDGSALLLQDGRSARLVPGGLAFYDASRPFRLVLGGDQRARVLTLPRALLRLRETQLRRLTATTLDDTEDGPEALLLPLLSGLAEEAVAAPDDRREQLARAAADVIAVLALHRVAEQPAPTAALLSRIEAFIESRLGDPDLTPQYIADQHGISLRYLHLLFQRQGMTVNSRVRARRLAAAGEELARPEAARRAVGAVAARWGFTSSAHFSRVFREAYGMSPVQWRRDALAAWKPYAGASTLPTHGGTPPPDPRLVGPADRRSHPGEVFQGTTR